jgi:hypothetical protein
MKTRTIVIGFFSVVFATTNAKAAVGETVAELIARYGEPENGLELMVGFGEWKTKQGGKVEAWVADGKAVSMLYGADDSGTGGVDEATKNTLLERNLPLGQKWVNSKAAKDFVRRHSKLPKDYMQFWETNDGKLWAFYDREYKYLAVGTAQYFKKEASIAETKSSGGF